MCDSVFMKRYEQHVGKTEDLSEIMSMLTLTSNRPPTLAFVEQVYNKCNSIAQSRRSRRGKAFETVLEDTLRDRGIPFITQASHNAEGIIVKGKKGVVHDFIVDARIGDSLKDKIIISCKTSLRERYKQDANLPCRKIYMVTLDKVAAKTKYEAVNLHIVSIGQDAALENMIRDIENNMSETYVRDMFQGVVI